MYLHRSLVHRLSHPCLQHEKLGMGEGWGVVEPRSLVWNSLPFKVDTKLACLMERVQQVRRRRHDLGLWSVIQRSSLCAAFSPAQEMVLHFYPECTQGLNEF